ncbi:hypothetical protein Y032_0512g2751 [Ancylostoma ceylanicum]|uniref:Uncharacterized protein n=1 Tax=Ancylostoma ceylanicum TaxID=53326 RepID=A0A016WV47_9BILA|nr:hypothetical protein Y032_0512g2751 [Ancylostoma ceylanicum]
MPYSTGSSDSGYCCVRKSKYEPDASTTTSSDRATSSITDEDEPVRYAPRRGGGQFTRVARGKSRRLRKKAIPHSDTSSRSSCSSSEVNSLTGEEERRHTLSREDIVKKVYMYFQSLLVNIRRQQKFFEQIGGLMADADARWGAGGLRKGWVDPAGCFAPYGFGDPSKPTAFPGCWAVPHPAVHLALLSSNLRDYLEFLSWLYPGIVGRGPTGTTRDDVPPQRGRGPEMGISEDILPILMQLLQQMGPMNTTAAMPPNPATPMDEAMLRQEKMRHLQQATAGSWSVQPALMQQLVTQLNQMQFAQQQQQQGQQTVAAAAAVAAAVPAVKKTSSIAAQTQLHTSPTKASSVDATMRPPSEYYSTVVARRPSMSGCEPGSGAASKSTSTSARHSATTGTTKLERKVRPTSAAENSAVTMLSLRDDTKTPCGGFRS